MKIARLKLRDGFYCNEEYSGNFWILTGFLTDDVGGWASAFKGFLQDPNRVEVGSNYTILEKEADDVLIGCIFDEVLFDPCIQMPQKELLSILNQWEELVKLRPAEIIIYKRGDSYVLEGRNPH